MYTTAERHHQKQASRCKGRQCNAGLTLSETESIDLSIFSYFWHSFWQDILRLHDVSRVCFRGSLSDAGGAAAAARLLAAANEATAPGVR